MKSRKNSIVVGIFLVFVISIVLYQRVSIYERKDSEIPSSDYGAMLSFVIEDESGNRTPSDVIPESHNYAVSISCDNGAKGVWNYETWSPLIKNVSQSRTKCNVEFVSKYVDYVLNGTDPVLNKGLIPVNISDDGSVTKASLSSEWYNYTNQKWANAVILENEEIFYADEEEIPEENIESYFVWIPRYRYKIFNEGNYEALTTIENKVQTIEVEFQTKDVSVSNGSKVGEWLTHPAFTSFDVNGMWVGKFETGYKGASSTTEAEQNIYDSSKVEIKPNVYSWRNIRISNAHLNSYNYKREMDSHMMKNTEWGAVAYLQHSAYGSRASVRINNNSAYITGYAAVNEPTCRTMATNEECNKYESTSLNVDGIYTKKYNTSIGYLASTTGNISGVYDMSGGAWEIVMGVMLDQNGNPVSGRNNNYNSNFIGTLTYPADGTDQSKPNWTASDGGIPFPDSKYYDTYAYGVNDENYNRRILGDATGEMGPFESVTYQENRTKLVGSWYGDEAWFVWIPQTWFGRGSNYDHGIDAGIFSFYHSYTGMNPDTSYRIVLSF